MRRLLCVSVLFTLGCQGPTVVQDLSVTETSRAAAVAEETASKLGKIYDHSFRRRDSITGCLNQLSVTPEVLCGEAYAGEVIVGWDTCPLGGGGTSTGKISIQNTRATQPPGTPCNTAQQYRFEHIPPPMTSTRSAVLEPCTILL